MSCSSGSKSFSKKNRVNHFVREYLYVESTSKDVVISVDGEVTDPALSAPEAGTALVEPSQRGCVDARPGVEASVSSRAT